MNQPQMLSGAMPITIRDIIEFRVMIDQIKHQSKDINAAKEKLDTLIKDFAEGLTPTKLN